MELRISTEQMLKILYILAWILFIGLCIEAGSYIFSVAFTLLINPVNAGYFNLSELFAYDPGYYGVVFVFMIITSVMKAFMFYLIVKLLHDKKLNLTLPFSKEVGNFIFHVSYLALGIGLFSFWGAKYVAWLSGKGIEMPGIQEVKLGGADVWLFMGIILFVIAHLFKRGIEIQSENELTI